MKMNTTFRRFLSLALVLSVLLGWVLPANALDLGINFRQVSNDRVYGDLFDREPANIQEDVKRYADSDSVRVSIILEGSGTIDAGYKPDGIAYNKAAMEYRARLKSEQVSVVDEIEAATDEELDVVWYMTLAANLISANVKYGQVDKIAKVSGVQAVIVEEAYNPAVVNSSAANPNMATSGVQTGAPITHAAGYTGAGSRIAVIDTGLDVEHISFDADAFNYSLANLAGKKNVSPDEYIAGLDLLDVAEIADVLDDLNVAGLVQQLEAEELYVNSKVPFGFNYIDIDLDITHENDGQGSHGSHVAGIASANTYVPKGDGIYENAIDAVRAQGVAPDAQLIVMKVFGKNGGAYPSDYMAAIEDAIMLGADSINLSLGSSNAGMTYDAETAYQLIMDNLVNSGAVVCISAGNNGAWSDEVENGIPYLYLDDVNMQTGGSPGSYTNSLGVASVDNAGYLSAQFVVGGKTAPYLETTGYGNASMMTVAGDAEYVFLNGIGKAEEYNALGVSLQDKVVLCYRGETSFFEKANEAASRGAKAVVIVNNEEGGILLNLTGYTYTIPVVFLYMNDGELFKENGTPITGANNEALGWAGSVKIDAGDVRYYDDPYYTMSAFSSWGVPGDLTMKPEITAPGGEIHSVGGANWNGEMMVYGDHASYEVMSGTSMAAPQVAGMAALVAQYIKENKLDEKTGVNIRALTQSLLMSTAVPLLDGNNDGYYYPVIQQGAGLANVSAAVMADSYLMMGADATASYADGKVKVELGDDPAKKGEYTFTFYINNLTNEEKTYLLSADFFTQGAFPYNNTLYMDTWTTPLAPNVTWMVNGKAVDTGADLVGMDFNGDGYINTNDGQALLDLAVGVRESIENAALADIDKDNDVDSHDAYLFFQMLGENGAVVPANGKTEVQVTVKLTDDDKAWLAYYENGAYLEGYVYAESMVSDEGVEGTSHSIPVLGFYGNWSDASMYDKGSFVEYLHGDETRAPYLYESTFYQGKYNGMTVTYHDEPGTEYWFGGNPYITDDVYMPERNAINALGGDVITSLGFAQIRNAAAITLDIWDPINGGMRQLVAEENYAAFYSPSAGAWDYTYNMLNLSSLPLNVFPNNTPLSIGITCVPEYYVNEDGSIDWASMGDGVSLSMPMVIDGEAPVVQDVDIVNETMTVTVKDNQYIAAIALYDSFGQYQYLAEGSKDQNAGDTVTYTLDLARVNGASFLLQVYDYACNTSTYEINDQIGAVIDTIERVEISENSVVMQLGNTKALSGLVYPVNAANRAVTWKSSDESIVSVDANGVLTANAVGTATITVAAAADETVTATCAVEVIDISAEMNAIVWDENGSIWFSEFVANKLPNYTKLSPDMLETDYFVSAAVGADGTLYASSMDPSTGTGSLYTIDPVTYKATKLRDCVVQGLHIFYSDLTYVPAMFGTGALLGTYGPYVIAIDPTTGTALGIIDEYGSDLVGITTCYGIYDADINVYQDVVYVIQNDGIVIQEMYYGYDGMVVPYMDYFYGERAGFDSGISVGDAWYFNSAYYDGNYLYWSAFDEETQNNVTLYAIDADYTGNVYTMGQFGDSVWPVGGLYQAPSAPPAGSNAFEFVQIPADAKLEMKNYDLAAYAASKKQAPATNDAARPMSDAVVEEPVDMITVKITAGDLQATAADSFTNGVTSVTYDAEALELKSVIVSGDYVASKKEAGKVTFGYVDLDGVDKDTVVATLVFDAKSADAKPVKVTYLETNNTKPGSTEDLDVAYPHKNTELINKEDPSCTEPGYTGDIYCHDCDSIITKGKEIAATGHKNTEIQGAKDATYTEPGYTGDTYCHDCKQVVAKGKEIPVKTAEGSGPPKTDDPFFFGMGLVIMMTAVSAMAVLTVVYKKKYRA